MPGKRLRVERSEGHAPGTGLEPATRKIAVACPQLLWYHRPMTNTTPPVTPPRRGPTKLGCLGWALISFFGVFVLGMIVSPLPEAEPEPEATRTEAPQASAPAAPEPEAEPLSSEERINQIAASAADEVYGRRVVAVSVSAEYGGYAIEVTHELADGFTPRLTRRGFVQSAGRFMGKIAPHGGDVVRCQVIGQAELTDQYGKKSIERVASVNLLGETLRRVSWENMSIDLLEQLFEADGVVWLHPALAD